MPTRNAMRAAVSQRTYWTSIGSSSQRERLKGEILPGLVGGFREEIARMLPQPCAHDGKFHAPAVRHARMRGARSAIAHVQPDTRSVALDASPRIWSARRSS